MLALTCAKSRTGLSFSVKQVPRPGFVGSKHVYIRVFASSLCRVEKELREGQTRSYLSDELQSCDRIGYEFSGVIEALGANCTRGFQVGDPVFGLVNTAMVPGTAAEYITALETRICRKPETISHVSASVVPLAALISESVLQTAKVTRDDKLLVLGGASVIGSFLIQYARLVHRVEWIGCTSSDSNRAYCEALGVFKVYNYKAQQGEWAKPFASGPVRHEYDVIIDVVGGIERAIDLLEPKNGRVVTLSSHYTAASILAYDAAHSPKRVLSNGSRRMLSATPFLFDRFVSRAAALRKRCKNGHFHSELCSWNYSSDKVAEVLEKVAALLTVGSIKPLVKKSFPLSLGADAMDYVSGFDRGSGGRAVLYMTEEAFKRVPRKSLGATATPRPSAGPASAGPALANIQALALVNIQAVLATGVDETNANGPKDKISKEPASPQMSDHEVYSTHGAVRTPSVAGRTQSETDSAPVSAESLLLLESSTGNRLPVARSPSSPPTPN